MRGELLEESSSHAKASQLRGLRAPGGATHYASRAVTTSLPPLLSSPSLSVVCVEQLSTAASLRDLWISRSVWQHDGATATQHPVHRHIHTHTHGLRRVRGWVKRSDVSSRGFKMSMSHY